MSNPDEASILAALAFVEVERCLAADPAPAESEALKAAKAALLDLLD
jgi:hypothetical protein